MPNKKISIEVLGHCRELIKILELYNLNISKSLSFDSLFTFLAIILILSFLILLILITWFLLDHGFILREISFAMPTFLGTCQISLVSFSLIRRKEIVYELINRLQSLIEERNFHSIDWIFNLNIDHFIFQVVRSQSRYLKFMKNVNRNIHLSQQLSLKW